jgi:hypothetical protein
VTWQSPFPFSAHQVVSHRLNFYWYIYVQAPPFSQLYYIFLLVDAIHNPQTQLVNPDAVGFYLSNLELYLHAELPDGRVDNDNVFWVSLWPATIMDDLLSHVP